MKVNRLNEEESSQYSVKENKGSRLLCQTLLKTLDMSSETKWVSPYLSSTPEKEYEMTASRSSADPREQCPY